MFNSEQVKVLADVFALDPTPPKHVHAALAERTGLSEHSVRVWFQNRRSRSKTKAAALALCALVRQPACLGTPRPPCLRMQCEPPRAAAGEHGHGGVGLFYVHEASSVHYETPPLSRRAEAPSPYKPCGKK